MYCLLIKLLVKKLEQRFDSYSFQLINALIQQQKSGKTCAPRKQYKEIVYRLADCTQDSDENCFGQKFVNK